jgi:hypothetical protein
MDISKLNTREACNQEVEIELKNPASGEPLGVFITIVGIESSVMAERERADTTKVVDSFNKTAKDATNEIIERAILGTVGWREFEWKGKKLEFNKANVEKIYKKDGFEWLPRQVHIAINDLALFMKG